MRPVRVLMVTFFLSAAWASASGMTLHRGRASRYDLEVAGRLEGVPAGESRYLRHSELQTLPATNLRLDGEFVHGHQTISAVFLADLMKALPLEPGADTIVATCSDGYISVYAPGFIERYRPFLVLEIDGKGPEAWPPPGLRFNPGPYVITISDAVAPGASRFPDVEHKKPWEVVKIEIVSYAERFRGIYSGPWADLPAAGGRGRETWVNSCASCHTGPAGIPGGRKAGLPFEVIAAFAGHDRPFFMRYVRDPKSLVPCAKMEPHPHYTDAQLDDLIAFITARR